MAEIDMAAVDAKSTETPEITKTPETPEITNTDCTKENSDIKNSEDGGPEAPKIVEEIMDTGGSGLSNYELRWNDHIPYFTNVFQSLREQNELTDVTFACEDGVVGAHKLVLSSCSPYLRALFARLAVPHPVIFLRNTPRALVHHLMEFVYSGVVSIPEGQLALVLNLGHSLQIQGLTVLKLSRENEDSATDEIAEEIGSEPQLLPGEIRPTPNYTLHNGQEMEYDSDSNKIERAKKFKQAKIQQTAVKVGEVAKKRSKSNIDDSEDVYIPKGWTRKVTQRNTGASAGKFDVYYYTPEMKKMRSKKEVLNYLEEKSKKKGVINEIDIDTGAHKKARPPKKDDDDEHNSLYKKDLDDIKKRKKLKGISESKEKSFSRNCMYNPSEYRVLGAYAEKYGAAAAMKYASKRYDRKVGRKAIETAQRMFRRSKPALADEATSKLAELIMVES